DLPPQVAGIVWVAKSFPYPLCLEKLVPLTDETPVLDMDAPTLVQDGMPNLVGPLPMRLEKRYRVFCCLGLYNNAEPDAHVIHLEHLCVTDVSECLDKGKNR